MPVLGFRDHWAMSCSLNLASCRLRAEALARQLHTNLWTSRSAQGSPGDSGSVSPCFGLPPLGSIVVIDRPPAKFRMSSLDDEKDEDVSPMLTSGGIERDEEYSGAVVGSPDVRPLDRIALLQKNGTGIYEDGKHEGHIWRPDSPPESFASESEVHSDSPALTIETEEPSSITSNSTTETVSELASPTYDFAEKENPLADELRNRLILIQSQTNGVMMTSPIEEVSETLSSSSTVSESSRKDLLSPPEPCVRLVRSTSLKTGKTPPDTPSRKKIVRFADAMGLDLEAVRHFAQDEDTPVPQSAFADLKIPTSLSAPLLLPWSNVPGLTNAGCRFVTQFAQPASDIRFLDRVRQQKVCLENVIVNDLKVTGIVRVLNLGFQKVVEVRYTTTEWAAHTDLHASYVPSSCDGFSDKFSFTLNLPHLSSGQRLLFALKYVANGQEFWDNNNGDNYVLRCLAKTPDQETGGVNGPKWLHHFM